MAGELFCSVLLAVSRDCSGGDSYLVGVGGGPVDFRESNLLDIREGRKSH